MNKQEKNKMYDLLREALDNADNANACYAQMKAYMEIGNDVQAEIYQRKADNYRGYAEGIHQALSVLNFNHENMEKLWELLR